MSTFSELYAAKAENDAALDAQNQTLQVAFGIECDRQWRAAFPRQQRHGRGKLLEIPGYSELLADWQEATLEIWRRHERLRDAFKSAMAGAARCEELPRVPELQRVHVSYAGTYSTQTQSSRYAKGEAETYADKAKHYGLRAEVRPDGELRTTPGIYGGSYQDYAVWADTTEIGAAMLMHRPGIPLRDWIRAYWKRGVNPRVYHYWLPYDLEEKLGLDYFGGETRPATDDERAGGYA